MANRQAMCVLAALIAAGAAAFVVRGCAAKAGPDWRVTEQFRKMGEADVAIVNDGGQEIRLKVKVADEDDERAAGFQNIGRKVIERSFILFVFPQETFSRFHMRNVVASLDIAFIARDGRILSIVRMTPGEKLYGHDANFRYALEARAGFFARHGIAPGWRLRT